MEVRFPFYSEQNGGAIEGAGTVPDNVYRSRTKKKGKIQMQNFHDFYRIWRLKM